MRLLIALLFFPVIATAQIRVEPWQVLSSVTNDWNDDGWPDRAVLGYMPGDEETVLWIYLGSNKGFTLDTVARGLVVMPFGNGPRPELYVTERGSLQVVSESDSGGRNFWSEVLTIAYREGQFVVAGYTDTNYDTLNPSLSGTCDVNYLARRGEFIGSGEDKTAFVIDYGPEPVDQWTIGSVPAACNM